MTAFLIPRHAHPLEREYEAWIVHGIERYFADLGLEFAIWAVSPDIEATWPADEKLLFGSKIVGLQFKQAKIAKLASGAVDFTRLKWMLHSPPGQFELVKKTPEIFYCLPTFIDRTVRSNALAHCLFWRPGTSDDKSVWYDNSAAHTEHKQVRGAMRWGHFIEALLSCEIGAKASTPPEARAHVARIYAGAREAFPRPQQASTPPPDVDTGLYVLVVKLPN